MKKFFKAISLLAMLAIALSLLSYSAFAADVSKLKVENGEVTLNGKDKGTVTVSWIGTGNDEIYSLEGLWSLKEIESTSYLKLVNITSEVVSFTGMNFVDVPSGKVVYLDDSFSNPGILAPGKRLLSATYEVAANTPAGEYTVQYKSSFMIGADGVEDETKYEINPKIVVKHAPDPISVNVPAAKTGLVYTGSEQQGVADGTGYTLTGHKQTKAGNHTATATLKSGYKWSDGTTAPKTISWTIAKADPTVTVPTGLKGTKDKALSTVALPSGWAWKAPTTVMSAVGDKTFAAVYTPSDAANYNTKEADITVKVEEAAPVITPVDAPAAKTGLVYTGSEQQGVADGTGYTLIGHKQTKAGTYEATATLKSGYKWSDGTTAPKTISWTIAKADPTVTDPTGLKGTQGDALSTVTLPEGWAWKAPATVMNDEGDQTFAAIYTPADANYNTKEVSLTVSVARKQTTGTDSGAVTSDTNTSDTDLPGSGTTTDIPGTNTPGSDENPPADKKGLSGGAIAGIIIGAVVLVGGAGCAVFFVIKKKK